MTSIDPAYLRPRLLQRAQESHKGDFGHLLIVAGCQTMPGAAVLATGAAVRSGCGLVTLHSTSRALQAVVNRFPSAMLSEEPGEAFSRVPVPLDRYAAIAVGPGLGRRPETEDALLMLLKAARDRRVPMVLDRRTWVSSGGCCLSAATRSATAGCRRFALPPAARS